MLVSIAIIGVLISIMLPGLSGVREHARRVICASNLRQVGLGLSMYSDDHAGLLPPSVFRGELGQANPAQMVAVRVDTKAVGSVRGGTSRERYQWDGLGYLFQSGHLPDGKVYYCPSHGGELRYDLFAARWGGADGEIFANYHFRGQGPMGNRRLDQIAMGVALAADGLRDATELNHDAGLNVLTAGLAMEWVADPQGVMPQILLNAASFTGGGTQNNPTDAAWGAIDDALATSGQGIALPGR